MVKDYKGITLRTTAFDFVPFTTSVAGRPVYDGIEVGSKTLCFHSYNNVLILQFKTFSTVAKALNFKYMVNQPKTGFKWGGVVSDILKEETDFGVSHLFLTHDRAQIMDYTHAVNVDNFCFLVTCSKVAYNVKSINSCMFIFQVPPAQELARWTALYRPLGPFMWVVTAVSLLVCLCFAYAYTKLYPRAGISAKRFVFSLVGSFFDNSQNYDIR